MKQVEFKILDSRTCAELPPDAEQQMRDLFSITQLTIVPRAAEIGFDFLSSKVLFSRFVFYSIPSFIIFFLLPTLQTHFSALFVLLSIAIIMLISLTEIEKFCVKKFLVWYARKAYRENVINYVNGNDLLHPLTLFNGSNGRSGVVALANEGEKIISMAFIKPEEEPSGSVTNVFRVTHVGTLPEWQHQGIGTEVVRKLVHEVAIEKFSALKLVLDTSSPQEPAIRIYTRLGFEVFSTSPVVLGVKKVEMSLNLELQQQQQH